MGLKMNGGTPKNLEEVVIAIACFRPPDGITPQDHWRAIIRDYVAQKFGVAMLKCHTPEQEALICELWTAITGEPCKKIGDKP
jgi:hypothetical protein